MDALMVAMTKSRTELTRIRSEKSVRSKRKVATATTITTMVGTKELITWNSVRCRNTMRTVATLKLNSLLEISNDSNSTKYCVRERSPL